MPLWQVRVLERKQTERERERVREQVRGTISIKSDTECIDKDPNSGNILGNNFKLHVCHGKVERPESPPAPAHQPNCDALYNFVNALENRIRAQARDGISHPKKYMCAFLLCPVKPSSVFHSKVCRCARFDTFSVALSLSQNTELPSLFSLYCCSSS